MMRDDAFNYHVDTVRTEVTGTQQIQISHVCDFDRSKSKEILADKNVYQVFSSDEGESESVIIG